MYPQTSWTWQEWHTYLLGHNPAGPTVGVTRQEMTGIWHRGNQQTPGCRHLLRFETRTQLGSLPATTKMCSELIAIVADEAMDKLNLLWHSLGSHYSKHGQGGELPILDAAAAALRKMASEVPGMASEDLEAFFPGRVNDEETYGLLAVGLLTLGQLVDGLFDVSFLCPDAPEKHSLSLLFSLPGTTIHEHTGRDGGYGIRIGVTLAGVDHCTLGKKQYSLPRLHQNFAISTCFAPDNMSTTKLRMSGYATAVTLT